MAKVEDPALLAQLDEESKAGKVADPALLAQLDAAPVEKHGPLHAALMSAMDLGGLTSGIAGAAHAVTEKSGLPALVIDSKGVHVERPAPTDKSLTELYNEFQHPLNRESAEHPIASTLGTTAGAAATALASAPKAVAQTALKATQSALPGLRGLLARLGVTATKTFFPSAMSGFAKSEAPTMAERFRDAGTAGLVGAGTGATLHGVVGEVLPAVTDLAKRGTASLGRVILPEPKINPAAASLEKQGIPLTLGQMAPDTFLGHLEEAASHNVLGMQAEREAAKEAWRNTALRRGAAPGAEAPIGGVHEQLASLYEGFEPAYAQIKGEQVYPAVHGKGIPLQSSKTTPGAFDLAVNDNNMPVDDVTRATVKRFLDNQLSILPGGATRPNMLQPVDAGDLLKIRSNIRAASRMAKSSGKLDQAYLLNNAEQTITDTIGSQLSSKASAHLVKTDQQYAKFMTLEDAASRAGPEAEFSPRQLGQAAKKSAGRRAYTQGQGGDLASLAQSGAEVFDQRVPPTGMRGVVLSGIPRVMVGPMSRIANLPNVRSTLLGEKLQFAPLLSAPPVTGQAVPLTLLANAARRRGLSFDFSPSAAQEDQP